MAVQQEFVEAVIAEKIILAVFGFGDAVSEEQERIFRPKDVLLFLEIDFFLNAKNEAFGVKTVTDRTLAAIQKRRVVSGAGIGEAPRLHVIVDVKHGDKKVPLCSGPDKKTH